MNQRVIVVCWLGFGDCLPHVCSLPLPLPPSLSEEHKHKRLFGF